MEKRKIRVSIVEDVEEVRESIKSRILEADDIVFVSAYEMGEQAILGLPKDQPDVVLLDIGLPGISGIECLLRVKMKAPEISFLMFTIFSEDEKVFDSLKAGAEGYVLKREGPQGVLNAIRELIDGGAPMSKEIAKKVLSSFHRFGPKNPNVEKLSAREIEILNCLTKGWLYKEIADRLIPPITEGTVKQHIHRIYRKLEVNNRTEAINKYLGAGEN